MELNNYNKNAWGEGQILYKIYFLIIEKYIEKEKLESFPFCLFLWLR